MQFIECQFIPWEQIRKYGIKWLKQNQPRSTIWSHDMDEAMDAHGIWWVKESK